MPVESVRSSCVSYSPQPHKKNILASKQFWRAFFIMLVKTLIPGLGIVFKDTRLEWKDVFKNKKCAPKQPTVSLQKPIQGSPIQFQVNRDSKALNHHQLTTQELEQHFIDGCHGEDKPYASLGGEFEGIKVIKALNDDEKQHLSFVLANLKAKLKEILHNKEAFDGKTVTAFPFFISVKQNKLVIKLPMQARSEQFFDARKKMNAVRSWVVISKSLEELGELRMNEMQLRSLLAGYVLRNVGMGLADFTFESAPYAKGLGVSFNI